MDVLLPNGATLKNVPEGTTKAEIEAKLGGVGSTALQAPGQPERSYWEEVRGGIASAPISAYLGAKQLTAGLSPEEEQIVELNRQAAGRAPVSSLLSNIATMAIPGGGLARMAKGGGKVAQVLRSLGKGLSTPESVAQAAAGGGAYMGLQPTLEEESRLQNIALGAGGGAGGYGVGKAIGRTLSTAKAAAIDPFTEKGSRSIAAGALKKATGGEEKARELAQILKTSEPIVPGTRPTTAEVGQGGGLSALQRAIAATDPEEFAAREVENNAARILQLQKIAGETGDVATAKAARREATELLYKQADRTVVDVDAPFKKLIERPSLRSAMKQAESLAKEEGVDIAIDPDNPAITGRTVNYMKQSIDDLIGKAEGNERRVLQNTKKEFMEWAEKNFPEYGEATKLFAETSKPIGRKQVGRALLEKVQPALADYGGTANTRAAAYAQALRSGEKTVKAATGFKQPLEKVMTPEEMTVLNNIAKDLARRANVQNLGRGSGSDTAQKLAMQNILESSGLPPVAQGVLQIPGSIASRMVGGIYGQTDDRARALLSEALRDPKVAATLLEMAGTDRAALAKILSKVGSATGISGVATGGR